MKTFFSVLAVLILIATTSFGDLAALLTAPRSFRVIGLQIVMTWRYIGTLLDEAQDMMTAYSLRAPGVKGIKMRDMGSFAGQLLLRSFDRAGRVYAAMKCRGFSGVYHGNRPAALRGGDWLYMIGTAAALLFLRFLDISLIFGALRFFRAP
jgi:cobalt/nickel transport system permease protein